MAVSIVTLQPDVHMRDNEETGGNGRSEELPYFPLCSRDPPWNGGEHHDFAARCVIGFGQLN